MDRKPSSSSSRRLEFAPIIPTLILAVALALGLFLTACDRGDAQSNGGVSPDGAGAPAGDLSVTLRQVDTLILQGQLAEAIQRANGVVALDPDMPGAHLALGRAYAALDDLQAAAENLEIELEISPDGENVLKEAADVYERLGERDKAIDLYSRYLEIKSDDQITRLALGRLLLSAGRVDEAAPLIEQAVERPSVEAFTALGQLHREQDRMDEAEAAVRRALEIEVRDSQALLVLGQLLVAGGRDVEGAAVLAHQAEVSAAADEVRFRTESSAMADASSQNFVLVGEALLAAGELEEAAKMLGSVIQRDPEAINAALGLAEIYALNNEVDAASQWVVHAMRVVPDSRRSHRAMAMVRILEDQPDLALTAIERSQRAEEWTDEDYRLMGKAYLIAGQADEAVSMFEAAMESASDDSELIVLRGIARLPGDSDAAAADFERARELLPYAAGPALAHGVVLHLQDDEEAGDAAFADAIQRRVPGGALTLGAESVFEWLSIRPEIGRPLVRYTELESQADGG